MLPRMSRVAKMALGSLLLSFSITVLKIPDKSKARYRWTQARSSQLVLVNWIC